ncbi:MAG: putative transposase [Clostridium sp.]|jgi:putative transposase
MSTPKLIWYEGAIYHITTRGNNKNDIFKDEEDFKAYLTTLGEALIYYSHTNYELVAYCLMDNHVHLIIKTGEEPLTRIMRRINSIYTRYFNKKYNYIGHLFQAKYFSKLIESDKQILEASRYVHLNPVKAKMVSIPEKYQWTSYRMFIGEKSKLVNTEIILSYFKYSDRYKLYKEFVEQKASSTSEDQIITRYK